MSRWERVGASELIIVPAIPYIVERVRALPGEFYLRAEVANALGVSPSTLRRIAAKIAPLAPSSTIMAGALGVPAYDATAVARLHAHLAEYRSRRGRPRLWSDEARRDRRAAYSAVGYRRRRAEQLRARGDHAEADRIQRTADQLAARLRRDHDRRSAGVRTAHRQVS